MRRTIVVAGIGRDRKEGEKILTIAVAPETLRTITSTVFSLQEPALPRVPIVGESNLRTMLGEI